MSFEAGHILPFAPTSRADVETMPSILGWSILASAGLILAAAICFGDYTIADAVIPEALCLILTAAVCGIALRNRGWQRVGGAAETLSQFMLAGLLAPIVSVVLARSDLPLRDASLAAFDQAVFGFDWHHVIAFSRDWPLATKALSYVYQSLMQQPPILLGILFVYGRTRTAQAFCQAWILTLAVTILCFPLMPAVGGYLHYEVARKDTYVLVEAAWRHIDVLNAAREGSLRAIDTRALEGIVTFPSFHAAAAVLMTWGFWNVPFLRMAALSVNLVMILSTPIIGGHYIVDVLAGIVVACFAIWFVERHPGVATRKS